MVYLTSAHYTVRDVGVPISVITRCSLQPHHAKQKRRRRRWNYNAREGREDRGDNFTMASQKRSPPPPFNAR